MVFIFIWLMVEFDEELDRVFLIVFGNKFLVEILFGYLVFSVFDLLFSGNFDRSIFKKLKV